jgi:hypothetical protein
VQWFPSGHVLLAYGIIHHLNGERERREEKREREREKEHLANDKLHKPFQIKIGPLIYP